jgi:hypothetical protein
MASARTSASDAASLTLHPLRLVFTGAEASDRGRSGLPLTRVDWYRVGTGSE